MLLNDITLSDFEATKVQVFYKRCRHQKKHPTLKQFRFAGRNRLFMACKACGLNHRPFPAFEIFAKFALARP